METTAMETTSDPVTGGLIFLALLIGYFFPFIIATIRRQPNNTAIFLVNLFFGWTLLGWVVALIWAVKAVEKPTVVYVERPAGDAGKGQP